MRQDLTDDTAGTALSEQILTATRSAWRWEQQPVYAVDEEDALYAAFLVGRPRPATDSPWLVQWYRDVAALSAHGVQVGRVRVVDEPATDYQRFLQWNDRWNIAAGEQIHYLPRSMANKLGRDPFGGAADWWLIDEARLVIMYMNDLGGRAAVEYTDESDDVLAACRWRDLILRVVAAQNAMPHQRAA